MSALYMAESAGLFQGIYNKPLITGQTGGGATKIGGGTGIVSSPPMTASALPSMTSR